MVTAQFTLDRSALTRIVIDELVRADRPHVVSRARRVAEGRRVRLGLAPLPTPQQAFNSLSRDGRKHALFCAATLVSSITGWDRTAGLAAVLVRAVRMGAGRGG